MQAIKQEFGTNNENPLSKTDGDIDIDIGEQCLEFGKILGLIKPVSREVLFAALDNGNYAHNLLTCRRNPDFMDYLLNNPPESTIVKGQKDSKLISRTEKALLKWSKTGFSIVDDETLKRREEACLSCSNLVSPVNLAEDVILLENPEARIGERTGKKICKICGCNASGKMYRSSASCPDKHPTVAGLTRWSEPFE
jgi:hypothetical protein